MGSVGRSIPCTVHVRTFLEEDYKGFCLGKLYLWCRRYNRSYAKTTPSGALEVELTPRSGRFAVLFGRLEDVERKFDKLLRFYRSGLSSIGWSEYRTIDIRYNDQVVCKK